MVLKCPKEREEKKHISPIHFFKNSFFIKYMYMGLSILNMCWESSNTCRGNHLLDSLTKNNFNKAKSSQFIDSINYQKHRENLRNNQWRGQIYTHYNKGTAFIFDYINTEPPMLKSTLSTNFFFSNMTNTVIFVTKISLGVAKITTVPFNLPPYGSLIKFVYLCHGMCYM